MILKSFIDTINSPVLIISSTDGRVRDCNKLAIQLIGYSKTEVTELSKFPIYDQNNQQLVDITKIGSGKYVLKTKGGKLLHIYAMVTSSGGVGSNELICFINDINQQTIEEEKILFHRMLSTLTKFAAHIAHEIRNPLGIMTMNLQFLQQTGMVKDNNEINFALKGGEKINNFLERITALANLSDSSKTSEDVNALIMEAIQEVLPLAKHKQQKFNTYLEDELPTAQINPKQIRQAFINILTSVIYYSPENSTITITSGMLEPPFINPTSDKTGVFIVIKDSIGGVSIEEFLSNFEMNENAFQKSSDITKPFTKDLLSCNNATLQVEKAANNNLITRIILS